MYGYSAEEALGQPISILIPKDRAHRSRGPRSHFRAPGDDLLCGTAERYRVVTSRTRIHPADFGKA